MRLGGNHCEEQEQRDKHTVAHACLVLLLAWFPTNRKGIWVLCCCCWFRQRRVTAMTSLIILAECWLNPLWHWPTSLLLSQTLAPKHRSWIRLPPHSPTSIIQLFQVDPFWLGHSFMTFLNMFVIIFFLFFLSLSARSRLGCQICLTRSLEGMTARVPDSVADIRQSGDGSS